MRANNRGNKSSIWMLYNHKSFLKIVSVIAFIAICGCIEEFTPDIDETANLLVVDGSYIRNDSIQKVTISRTSGIGSSKFNPLSGCTVSISDESFDIYIPFTEWEPGEYYAVIPKSYLPYNKQIKLGIITPEGIIYESDYETVLECSDIDSVYYLEEAYQSSSQTHDKGMQFYADLKASEGATQYYRWKMTESWEYHSSHYIYGHWDINLEKMIIYGRYIDSLYKCYNHKRIKRFVTATTDNLLVNEKKKIPLNYIPGDSEKIRIKYSLLVKQYALSESAYLYWEKNRVESEESGGLYNTQPGQSITNIKCISNPDEKVLGFFWASSYTTMRIYYRGPFTKVNNSGLCKLEEFDFDEPQLSWPITYVSMMNSSTSGLYGTASAECFDCRLKGGTTTKPDFWDNF